MPTYLGANSDINIDDSGNLAFGSFDVEAWYSGVLSIQLSASVAISWSKTTNNVNIVTNAYQSTSTVWNYRANGFASRINIVDNFIVFYHAVSGLANDPITWEQEMTVENLGKVTVGAASSLGKLSLQPNEAADAVAVGGILHAFQTNTGNSGSTETAIATFTLIALTLVAAGQSLRFEAHGTTANNANVKTLRVKFGASTIATRVLTPSVAGAWCIRGTITCIAALNQECIVIFNDESTSQVIRAAISGDSTNSNQVLQVTGQGTSTNDIICRAFKVWWDDKP